LAGWFAIVAALGLGLTLGAVVFGGAKQPPPTTVVVTQPAALASATENPVASAAASANGAVEIAAVEIAPTGGKPRPASQTTGVAKTTADATPPPPVTPLAGGPSVPALGAGTLGPGPSLNNSNSSSSQLTSDQIQPIVNNGRASLKRACWEPAFAAKGGGMNTARVQVEITIGADGRVQSAVPSGGDGFSSLGACIASRVRQWSFPASAGVTKVSPAFNFISQ